MTIAAGVRLADLSRWLGGYPRIVRAMPNTPALVGAGITGVFAPTEVDDGEPQARGPRARGGRGGHLGASARTCSTRSPAYPAAVRLTRSIFSKALEDAARELGLSATRTRASSRTRRSRAPSSSRRRPTNARRRLRAQVTSKGGTTERALSVLDERAVKATFVAAVKGGRARGARGARRRAAVRRRQGSLTMAEQIIKYLLDVVFGLFTYALLLRFAMQTMRAPFRNPMGQAVIALTDWIVKPLRRVLPGFKGIDWASLVATVLFQFLWLLALCADLRQLQPARRPAFLSCWSPP